MSTPYGPGRKLAVESSAEGIRVLEASSGLYSTTWESIQRVEAVKRVANGIGTVWLRIECDGSDGPVEISEDLPGFRELVRTMSDSLPGMVHDWFGVTVFPPNEERRVLVYSRPASPSEARN